MERIQNGGPRANGFSSRKMLKGIDQLAWQRISYKALFALLFATPALVQYGLGLPFWCYPKNRIINDYDLNLSRQQDFKA